MHAAMGVDHGRGGQVHQNLERGIVPQILSCCKILRTRLLALQCRKMCFFLYSRTFIVSPAICVPPEFQSDLRLSMRLVSVQLSHTYIRNLIYLYESVVCFLSLCLSVVFSRFHGRYYVSHATRPIKTSESQKDKKQTNDILRLYRPFKGENFNYIPNGNFSTRERSVNIVHVYGTRC